MKSPRTCREHLDDILLPQIQGVLDQLDQAED